MLVMLEIFDSKSLPLSSKRHFLLLFSLRPLPHDNEHLNPDPVMLDQSEYCIYSYLA